MGDIYVTMKDIEKTYVQWKVALRALESVTGEVVPGDRIAVVGPSGSGKSTLLHIMGGIDVPTSGSIAWPSLGKREELRPKKVGFIFQTVSLVASLTAVENVALPLLLTGENPSESHKAALEALECIGLESIADKLPEELSGGQAQRVATARTLTSRPKLILADEPTGQLDHPTAQHLFDVLLDYIKSSDIALIVATHDAAIARRMEDVWHLNYGRLEAGK
jgi:ABC-type lipoprotein export system ATPase subunit